MIYVELVKGLREHAERFDYDGWVDTAIWFEKAADAIEELLRAAKKMHLWIFLNTGDEQKSYDECGLSDEMNVALGYSGQFEIRAESQKEET